MGFGLVGLGLVAQFSFWILIDWLSDCDFDG